MDADVRGKVDSTILRPQQAMLPVYEAISNSIHAIEDGHGAPGYIVVRVLRQSDQRVITEDLSDLHPIVGFEIEDNGVGFDDDNLAAFSKMYTGRKRSRGGKGAGRFIWLKAFDHAEVSSVWSNDGELHLRKFDFIVAEDPVANLSDESIATPVQVRTVVRLVDMRAEYSERLPKRSSSIAQRIVEHFLSYFVLGGGPKLYLEDNADVLDLDEVYESILMTSGFTATEFSLGGARLTISHAILHGAEGRRHAVHYCANRRVVETRRIDAQLIADLPTRISLTDDDAPGVYVAFVEGEVLDRSVGPLRTSFDLLADDNLVDGISRSSLDAGVLEQCALFLAPWTNRARVEKWRRFETFVGEERPQYRYILAQHPEKVAAIPPGIPEAQLDIEFYKIHSSLEVETRERADAIAEHGFVALQDDDLRNGQSPDSAFDEFLDDWNEQGKSTLVQYVIHRRRTLAMLDGLLKRRTDTASYALEQAVHRLIFPLRATSDEVTYEQQNLWILDEKLAFHSYLASDLPLKKNRAVESTSDDRPDLIIFDRPIAVTEGDPLHGVVIFEFKRPMRKDGDPIEQVLRYVSKIRAGGQETAQGRPLRVDPNTPFYCYVVCDITPSIERLAALYDMTSTPDGKGYFMFHKNNRAFVQIMSYDQILKESYQRNQILFAKLGLAR